MKRLNLLWYRLTEMNRHLVMVPFLVSLFAITLLINCTSKTTEEPVGPLKSFTLAEVKVTGGPFYEAQMTDMDYILEMNVDRLLAPFMIDAGMTPKAERYGNWENTGLDGHIGGHYLTALAQMYQSAGNKEILERLNYMVDVLAECQEKNGNGYVGGIPEGQAMWEEIAKGNIDAGSFSLNDKWVPLYNIHKLYAGLRDAYLIGGNEKAKTVLIDLSDWLLEITSNLSDEQIQEMLISEHGGMNEVLADVSELTGDKKYMELARKFSDRQILDPLLRHEDELTGLHANTQIPKVIGYERIGELDNDTSWVNASKFFWETVVENRTVSIGGNSVREHFHPVDDFSPMLESIQGPETCNTYNMLRLSKMLFLHTRDTKYLEYYEQGLYNHILSSQHPDGGFVYFTPMRPRHFRVYSQPHESFWCCVGSGIENHGKYAEMIYAYDDQGVYVNLFIPSVLQWKEHGLELRQETEFPFSESSSLKLNLDNPGQFQLNIRVPEWLAEDDLAVQVNGSSESFTTRSDYVVLDRKWNDGDEITFLLPMETSVKSLPDGSAWVSFMRGPVVLGAVTDSTDLDGLWADDSRMGHVANDRFYPLDEAPMLVADNTDNLGSAIRAVEGSPMTFSAASLMYPEDAKNLKLVPFFQIHEARYMIYWPVVKEEELEGKLATLKEREKEKLALEARTVDQIAPGEQQPESEHDYQGKEDWSGLYQGRFWRASREWFSYELENPNNTGKILRITLFKGEPERDMNIYLDGKLISTIGEDEDRSQEFYDVDFRIPEGLGSKMTLKFEAREGASTGAVYYIRLLEE